MTSNQYRIFHWSIRWSVITWSHPINIWYFSSQYSSSHISQNNIPLGPLGTRDILCYDVVRPELISELLGHYSSLDDGLWFIATTWNMLHMMHGFNYSLQAKPLNCTMDSQWTKMILSKVVPGECYIEILIVYTPGNGDKWWLLVWLNHVEKYAFSSIHFLK